MVRVGDEPSRTVPQNRPATACRQVRSARGVGTVAPRTVSARAVPRCSCVTIRSATSAGCGGPCGRRGGCSTWRRPAAARRCCSRTSPRAPPPRASGCWCCVHRIELVRQTVAKLEAFGVTAGLVTARRTERLDAGVVVAAVQTLDRRKTELGRDRPRGGRRGAPCRGRDLGAGAGPVRGRARARRHGHARAARRQGPGRRVRGMVEGPDVAQLAEAATSPRPAPSAGWRRSRT